MFRRHLRPHRDSRPRSTVGIGCTAPPAITPTRFPLNLTGGPCVVEGPPIAAGPRPFVPSPAPPPPPPILPVSSGFRHSASNTSPWLAPRRARPPAAVLDRSRRPDPRHVKLSVAISTSAREPIAVQPAADCHRRPRRRCRSLGGHRSGPVVWFAAGDGRRWSRQRCVAGVADGCGRPPTSAGNLDQRPVPKHSWASGDRTIGSRRARSVCAPAIEASPTSQKPVTWLPSGRRGTAGPPRPPTML